MKGTLLLALLVTGELSFQTTESLVPFFNVYASVLSGKRLYQELQTFNATAEVKVALEKNLWLLEENLRNMLLEPQIKEAMIASQESQSNYEVDNIRSILDYISRLLGE
ncbi:secretoglobin, family 2B, member 17 isoform X1 [Mus musculus]|uniref:ABPBG15_bg17 n=3 Tax=Mus musculus TaxID=10090 RepID=A0A089N3E7_MOUSE|nr:secretoglobin, family 2B, member 15 isoform X1 [Mus musculus]XP_001004121.2 secretoglobin, family 2B, member 17 isoform X1 [Mus musculus]AIQ80442.1 ABPBG15_bg17 [Mus musculus]|eukprot:XP_001004117.2 PREDICTED: secretoglobin, family 2B, member 15 isoform X1 [Mus musculus]